MEFATGAMGTLLPKLGELLQEEYNLQRKVKEGIRDLKAELESMQAALVKVSNVPLDQLDSQVNLWASAVRDLSYAIEDKLDSFMVRVEGIEPTKPDTFMGFIKKIRNKVTKLKIRHDISNDIKDIESQVRKVKERYDRYKVEDVVANLSKTTIDPRLLALYNKVSNLVGIEKAANELMKMMSEGGDNIFEEKLKTVSVVGFGGLGKTTLAKAVYDKLNKKFDLGAFVPVGRNPDAKKVLRDILLEFDTEIYNASSTMDERQLINQLQKILEGTRYLVVIDDIWDIQTWEIIKVALVDSNTGSRIITTTRIREVSSKIGGVYNIKPLSDDNSKKLFNSRIFGDKVTVLDDQSSTQVFDKLLKKCNGVPLSIITIASLLVGKRREDWSKVYDCIGFGHNDNNQAVQNTRKILSFSYYDLPSHLKTCLLYLSIYPEDYWIEKNALIWKWIAEGFIHDQHGIGLFEVGESYFNELINRNMIQFIEPYSRRSSLGGCQVHDTVVDLIRVLSNQINFITIHDTEQHGTSSATSTSSIARRLALHKTLKEDNHSMEMRHVRSINAITCPGSRIPALLIFKVLRVLVLEKCEFTAGVCHLENLGKLVQLRYLGLAGTRVVQLPSDIGHNLKFLQTLDLRGTGLKEVPASVCELPKLMCLCASGDTRVMAGIGKLTSLEELRLRSVDKSPDFAVDVGKLTKLRVLEISFTEMEESMHKDLLESLWNLRRIQSLEIKIDTKSICFGGWEDWAPPPSRLRRLALSRINFPRRPSWIDSSHVPDLSYLFIMLQAVETRDMQILGKLPSLRILHMVCTSCRCLPYTVGRSEFQKLRCFTTNMMVRCGEGAALPMLEQLDIGTPVEELQDGDDNGLAPAAESMPLLQSVSYALECKGRSGKEVEAAETALRRATATHPNNPTVKIHRNHYNEQVSAAADDRKKQEMQDIVITLSWLLGDADGTGNVAGTDQEQRVRMLIAALEASLPAAADDGGARGVSSPVVQQKLRDFITSLNRLIRDQKFSGAEHEPFVRVLITTFQQKLLGLQGTPEEVSDNQHLKK